MADEHDTWLAGIGVNVSNILGNVAPDDQGAGDAGATDTAKTTPTGGGDAVAVSADTGAPPATGGGDYAQGIATRICAKIKAGSDLAFDVAMLTKMDMPTLLDVLDRLKTLGEFEDFSGAVPANNARLGVAVLTVRGDFDAKWQQLAAKLNDADKKAVLTRAPDSAKAAVVGGSGSGAAAGAKDGPGLDADAVISVGKDGAEVQAKLTFNSSLAGNLGDTEFTVHIGPNGKLSQFEVDMTLIQQRILKSGATAAMLDIQATLSLNSTVNLDQKATRVIFNAVQAQAKGEIEIHFKAIDALKKVAFKLTATAGSAGFDFGASIEIPIPGT